MIPVQWSETFSLNTRRRPATSREDWRELWSSWGSTISWKVILFVTVNCRIQVQKCYNILIKRLTGIIIIGWVLKPCKCNVLWIKQKILNLFFVNRTPKASMFQFFKAKQFAKNTWWVLQISEPRESSDLQVVVSAWSSCSHRGSSGEEGRHGTMPEEPHCNNRLPEEKKILIIILVKTNSL